MSAELIVTVISLILKYGVPAAIQIYQTWSGDVVDPDQPSFEDMERLKTMTPDAASFFEEE